jgi:hypothetical protein
MRRNSSPFKWRHAPELNKRMRPHLKMSGASYRLDETYVKVGTEWKICTEPSTQLAILSSSAQRQARLFCGKTLL